MITLLIGPNERIYYVHAHLLLQESQGYFKYRLVDLPGQDGAWHKMGTIADENFSEEEAHLFGYVIEWLYTKAKKSPAIYAFVW